MMFKMKIIHEILYLEFFHRKHIVSWLLMRRDTMRKDSCYNQILLSICTHLRKKIIKHLNKETLTLLIGAYFKVAKYRQT